MAVEGADRPTSASSSHSAAKVTEEVVKTRLQKELVSGICDTIEKMLVDMKKGSTVVESLSSSSQTSRIHESLAVNSNEDEQSKIIRLQQEEIILLRQRLQLLEESIHVNSLNGI